MESDGKNEIFLRACGGTGPLRLRVRGLNTGAEEIRILPQPFALIGRDPRSDVVFDPKLVGSRQVYLQLVAGELFWVDLHNRVGATGRGREQKSGWLDPGGTLHIGPCEVQRVMEEPRRPSPDRAGSTARVSPFLSRSYIGQELPEVDLEFLNGPSQATRWPMNRVLSLMGSADGNKFRLADPSVSAFHCSLLRTPTGLWVVDLLGLEGISVNGVVVRFSPLVDGDVLQIGRYQIRIHSRLSSTPSVATGPLAGRPPLSVRRESVAPVTSSLALSNGITEIPSLPSGVGSGPRSGPPPAGVPSLRGVAEPPADLGWTPATLNAPLSLEKSELSESVLVPLVNQFGIMQQQMLDQFQQAITMLVQMFGSLHQDQMRVIREELDQLRDLTEELRAVRQDLANRAQAPSQSGTSTIGTVAPPPATDGIRLLEDIKDRIAARQVSAERPRTPANSEPAPDARDLGQPAAASTGQGEPLASDPAPQPAEPSAQASKPVRKSAAGVDGEDPERDVIIWLHQRMMTLQRERESRWQRILKMLPGLS